MQWGGVQWGGGAVGWGGIRGAGQARLGAAGIEKARFLPKNGKKDGKKQVFFLKTGRKQNFFLGTGRNEKSSSAGGCQYAKYSPRPPEGQVPC